MGWTHKMCENDRFSKIVFCIFKLHSIKPHFVNKIMLETNSMSQYLIDNGSKDTSRTVVSYFSWKFIYLNVSVQSVLFVFCVRLFGLLFSEMLLLLLVFCQFNTEKNSICRDNCNNSSDVPSIVYIVQFRTIPSD